MSEYALYQLNDEQGDIYFNSSPDVSALIAAGKDLATQFPGTAYAVKQGDKTIWSSKGAGSVVSYRLIRKLEDNIDLLLLPGKEPDLLIQIGRKQMEDHSDWMLEVCDADRNVIWSSE